MRGLLQAPTAIHYQSGFCLHARRSEKLISWKWLSYQKQAYRFNATPIKILALLFTEIGGKKPVLKFMCKHKRLWRDMGTLSSGGKLPALKLSYRVIVLRTPRYWPSTVRFHILSGRMAATKNLNINAGDDPHCCGEMWAGAGIVKTNTKLLKKLKVEPPCEPSIPPLWIYPKDRDISTSTLTVTVCTTAKE